MKRFIPLFLMLVAASACGGNRQEPAGRKPLAHAVISLPTMKCDLCAQTIQKSAQKVEGVQSITVKLETKSAHVSFDSVKTSMGKIEKAIAAAGYDANTTKRNEKAYARLPKCCQ